MFAIVVVHRCAGAGMDGRLTIKRDSRARRAKVVYHNLSVPYDSGKLDRASISRTLGAAATGEARVPGGPGGREARSMRV